MTVQITNISSFQRLVRLSSGVTRRLAPGESIEVERVEVKNPRLKRLVQLRAISVKEAAGGRRRQSRDFSATGAVEYIEGAKREELEGFLSPDEDRVTVLRAMEERLGG